MTIAQIIKEDWEMAAEEFLYCAHCDAYGFGFLECQCEELCTYYGECGCSECEITYTFGQSVWKYVEQHGLDETMVFYRDDLNRSMPEPCSACSPAYIAEKKRLLAALDEWTMANSKAFHKWENERPTRFD